MSNKQKVFINIVFFLGLQLTISNLIIAQHFSGEGIEDNPYLIEYTSQISKINDFLSNYFIVTNDTLLNDLEFGDGEVFRGIDYFRSYQYEKTDKYKRVLGKKNTLFDWHFEKYKGRMENNTSDSSKSFISIWKTDNPGASNSHEISIPTIGEGYDYNIYWESVTDTSVNGRENNIDGNITIAFPEIGIFRVEISGFFPRIYFNTTGDCMKILQIEQWGDIKWQSMNRAFSGAENLQITASDSPDLTNVKDMTGMFNAARALNEDLSTWDVSNV
ncbi:MAG: BspA family leucine-rich repeat surface protein [Candidatus Paceibacterota bacterium]